MKLLPIALFITTSLTAGFGDGFVTGAFTGFVAGNVVERINQRPVVVYERPYYKDDRAERARFREEQRRRIRRSQTADLEKRKLAIREKELDLDLLKAKEALLREENRKKELTLKLKAL